MPRFMASPMIKVLRTATPIEDAASEVAEGPCFTASPRIKVLRAVRSTEEVAPQGLERPRFPLSPRIKVSWGTQPYRGRGISGRGRGASYRGPEDPRFGTWQPMGSVAPNRHPLFLPLTRGVCGPFVRIGATSRKWVDPAGPCPLAACGDCLAQASYVGWPPAPGRPCHARTGRPLGPDWWRRSQPGGPSSRKPRIPGRATREPCSIWQLERPVAPDRRYLSPTERPVRPGWRRLPGPGGARLAQFPETMGPAAQARRFLSQSERPVRRDRRRVPQTGPPLWRNCRIGWARGPGPALPLAT